MRIFKDFEVNCFQIRLQIFFLNSQMIILRIFISKSFKYLIRRSFFLRYQLFF